MLKISNLNFSYSKNRKILANLSLEIPAGSVCGLLGKNGAGKSTILYLMCGLLTPESGSIEFNGMTPTQRLPEFLEDVFLVAEEFRVPNVTLEEYIRVNSPFYPKFNHEAMRRYLEIFELDEDLHLGKLSMGQKKKAFISFAMACNTRLLILDEPTNGLDITAKRNFRSAIAQCMNEEKTIVISTHQVYDVEKIIDHVIIADKGGIALNKSMLQIQDEFKFGFTTDRQRADHSLMALDAPGGMNVMEHREKEEEETEVNLETLFEYTMSKSKSCS